MWALEGISAEVGKGEKSTSFILVDSSFFLPERRSNRTENPLRLGRVRHTWLLQRYKPFFRRLSSQSNLALAKAALPVRADSSPSTCTSSSMFLP